MANIGKLNVTLVANSGPFTKGLKRAQKRITRFGASMRKFTGGMMGGIGRLGKRLAIVGGIAAGALVLGLKKAATAVDDLAKKSRALLGGRGATGALAGMRLAASHAGVEVKALDKGLAKMLETISKAANEDDIEAIEALDRIGIGAKRLAAANPQKRLELIAGGISKIADVGDRLTAARGIFGAKAGIGLVELFSNGAESIKSATRQADLFGHSLTSIQSGAVEKMNDSLTDIGAVINGVFIQSIAKIAPIINKGTAAFLEQVEVIGGVGKATDTMFTFMTNSIGDAISGVEKLHLSYLKLKKLLLAPFDMKRSKDVDKIVKHSQDRKFFQAFPESRREQARGIAKAGGITPSDPSAERSKAVEKERSALEKQIADMEKGLATNTGLGEKFKAFAFEAAKIGEGQLDTQKGITSELEKQVAIGRGKSGSGSAALAGLSIAKQANLGRKQIDGRIQVSGGRDALTGQDQVFKRWQAAVQGKSEYEGKSLTILGRIADSVQSGQVAVAG